jgi:hypothetical protein
MAQITKQDMFNGLVAKGWTPEAAASAVGHASVESSFVTHAIGDNGTSAGLMQWHGPRWEALKGFAVKNGMDWRDPQSQIDFLDHEVRSNPQWAGLPQEKDYGKAQATMMRFESPANPGATAQARWEGGAGLLTNPPTYSGTSFASVPKGSGGDDSGGAVGSYGQPIKPPAGLIESLGQQNPDPNGTAGAADALAQAQQNDQEDTAGRQDSIDKLRAGAADPGLSLKDQIADYLAQSTPAAGAPQLQVAPDAPHNNAMQGGSYRPQQTSLIGKLLNKRAGGTS